MLMGSRDQKELTKYLQLNAVAFSDWKSGKSNSYKKYLIEIAKFFNVSIDYLVYGKTSDSSLRTDEEELLQNYNSVDTVAKARIRERLKAESVGMPPFLEKDRPCKGLPFGWL